MRMLDYLCEMNEAHVTTDSSYFVGLNRPLSLLYLNIYYVVAQVAYSDLKIKTLFSNLLSVRN